MSLEVREEPEVRLITRLLGGKSVLSTGVKNRMSAHDAISRGLPASSVDHLLRSLRQLRSDPSLEKAVGIGKRTIQRRAGHGLLSPKQSERMWEFAGILSKATTVLGSQALAESWLASPALGLNGRRPLDLITTTTGAELVKELLERMEFGVYA